MQKMLRHWPAALSLWVSFVFLQSLFFKFTDSRETIGIFTKLDGWAASFGLPGLFAHTGLFSQYVIGTAELIASTLVLLGITQSMRLLRVPGAALGLAVMSGAIFFHLFTPLGIKVINSNGVSDGGELFTLACTVWVSCAVLLFERRHMIAALIVEAKRCLCGGFLSERVTRP